MALKHRHCFCGRFGIFSIGDPQINDRGRSFKGVGLSPFGMGHGFGFRIGSTGIQPGPSCPNSEELSVLLSDCCLRNVAFSRDDVTPLDTHLLFHSPSCLYEEFHPYGTVELSLVDAAALFVVPNSEILDFVGDDDDAMYEIEETGILDCSSTAQKCV